MFANKARSQLRSLQTRLDRWQESVPPRARRFHDSRQEVSRRIRPLLGRWWQMWISADELERLGGQVRRLEHVADGLGDLVRSADKLEDEARQLGAKAAEAGDSELAAWLEAQAREWLIRVQQIGTNCDRRAELYHDQQILTETESELRLHSTAADWLEEAHGALETLDADPLAAGLKVALPDFRDQLYRDGASQDWIEALAEQVKPLKERADRVRDPPPELQTVTDLLTDLRGWSGQLGELESEVLELDRHQQRFVAVDWTDEDSGALQEVVDRARSLRTRLLDQALEARRRELERLQRGIHDLFQACGPQPELKDVLKKLEKRHQRVSRHHQHGEWLKGYDRAYNREFKGIASSNQTQLETRLSSLREDLLTGLGELRSRPLSDAVRQDANELEHDVRELSRLEGVEKILGGLRHTPDLERRLEELDRGARQDIQDLKATQAALEARSSRLQAEAARIELDLPGLGDEIEALGTVAELEQARQAAGRLEGELDTQSRQLVERCRELLVEWGDKAVAVAGALRQTGNPVEDPPEVVLGDDVEPRHATEAAEESVQLYYRLSDQAGAAIADLDRRRLELRAELEPLRLEDLAPGDREDADQLLVELEEGSWSDAEDNLERLRLLAQLVEKCELLLGRLRQDQIAAEQHLDNLRRRLRRFNEAQLRRHCPELTDRVTALVYGVSEQPRQWAAVRHQLELAEKLFGRLERQATRLAARDLERAAEALRRPVPGAPEEAAATAEALLAELAACGHGRLPPVTLRMRLLNAAPRWQGN